MQIWRVNGLVLAVLAFGLIGGCGSDGGGKDPDADADADDAEGGDADSTRPIADSGMDASEDAEVDACVSTVGCDDLEAEGVECGQPLDNCGEPLDCGGDEKCVDPDDPATEYFTCGGGGEFKCGCTPKSCDDALVCGTLPDGCGGELACGDECEDEYHTCNAQRANECGCAPNLSACGTAQCGTAPDDCGGTVQCGTHGGGCSDARTCNASRQCECKPQAELCAGKCGVQTLDGCPTVNCGACGGECGPSEACGSCSCPGAGAVCANNACCTPEPLATTCGTAVCGTKVNNCGQTVTCGTGTCAGGQQCTSAGQCVDPTVAALTGKYAVRAVSFGAAAGVVSRSEVLILADISLNSSGKLVMHEQGCWSAAYTKTARGEATVSELLPQQAEQVFPVVTELDLSRAAPLAGPKEWVRGVQPPSANALGWRRGRPAYCPARGAPTDQPAADVTHPAFAPSPDRHALGAKKPWLNGGTCLCPEQEVAKRGLCEGQTGAALAACIDDWTQNTLPHAPGRASPDEDVTDCRVVDDEVDLAPGVTIDTTVQLGFTLRAKIRSAATLANVMWGKIDLSGAKQHWGVSEDQPELQQAAVACVETSGGLADSLLCATSSGDLCAPYSSPDAVTKDGRVNPVDFAPLDSKQPPTSEGWTCQAIYDSHRQGSLFGPAIAWSARYPTNCDR